MNPYEQKLKQYITEHHIHAKHLSFFQSCHSVAEAAQAANAKPEDFVKSICMVSGNGMLIVAIVKGEDKASTTAVGKALDIQRPRLANTEEILAKTGYPCGGTPPFGYSATFLIDPRVMEMPIVYAGGGSEKTLMKISPNDLQQANGGKIVRIRR